jgi:hypothetical protein
MTHYETLQVSRSAGEAVIRASYRVLIQKYHPDKHSPRDEAEHLTRLLNEAYRVLSDPELRAEYDASIDASEPVAEVVPEPGPAVAPAVGDMIKPAGNSLAYVLWLVVLVASFAIGGLLLAFAVTVAMGFWHKSKRMSAFILLVGFSVTLSLHFAGQIAAERPREVASTQIPAQALPVQSAAQPPPQDAWDAAFDRWAQDHPSYQDFTTDANNIRAMQSELNAVYAANNGSMTTEQMLSEAFQRAVYSTKWEGPKR